MVADDGFGQTDVPFYELAIPLVPIEASDADVVADWQRRFARGERPCAISLCILQWVKMSGGRTHVEQQHPDHLTLSHFLIDGHHNMLAAARDHREIDVAAFLCVDSG